MFYSEIPKGIKWFIVIILGWLVSFSDFSLQLDFNYDFQSKILKIIALIVDWF